MSKPAKRCKISVAVGHKKTTYTLKTNRFAIFVVIVILAAIPFGMGKYLEFNSPGPYDSGAYVYSAKHVLDGAKLGVDENPSAHVGTLLVNMLGVWVFGFNETGPKLMQLIFQASALTLMFLAMRKLFGTLAGAVGVIVASIYLSAPLIAKFGNVKEQYMISFAVMGVSCFVLGQLSGRKWLTVLSGALLVLSPLFKPTGMAAIGAVALFVVAQPLLKHKSFKQTGIDIALLFCGAGLSLGPLYIWAAMIDAPARFWPYSFAWKMLIPQQATDASSTYIGKAREAHSFSQQWPKVLRFYGLLILPISLAAGSIIVRLGKMVVCKSRSSKEGAINSYDKFVLLFAVWWVLEMGFVWISPRSYEQYYLPLNASAAMLGGYLIAVYRDKLGRSIRKTKWVLVGLAGAVCMAAMSGHIFFGIEKSPHSGTSYGQKRKGYAQALNAISQRKQRGLKGPWQVAGDYIRTHSGESDKIYVWGWYPGIYVRAQRLSSAASAFTSEMHVKSPEELLEMVAELLASFEREMPKFIVDSRKRHFPWNRPLLELWPLTPRGFLPLNKKIIEQNDLVHSKMLYDTVGLEESLRYKVMKPFREFVMYNYKIVKPIQKFWPHVLFELRESKAK